MQQALTIPGAQSKALARLQRAELKQREREFWLNQAGDWADRAVQLMFNPVIAMPVGFLILKELNRKGYISNVEAAVLGFAGTATGLAKAMPPITILRR